VLLFDLGSARKWLGDWKTDLWLSSRIPSPPDDFETDEAVIFGYLVQVGYGSSAAELITRRNERGGSRVEEHAALAFGFAFCEQAREPALPDILRAAERVIDSDVVRVRSEATHRAELARREPSFSS